MDTIATSPTKTPPLNRLFSWRLARRVLIGVAVLATLVAAFYTEENWRGKRAWEKCRRELEARGAVFDWVTRIPPPVADDQNFFGAPNMAEWFAGRRTNDFSKRLDDPKTHSISIDGTNAIQTEVDARDYLTWSDQFLPDFDEIRTALKRPYARIDCDYGQPTTVLAPNFRTIRDLVQTLAQRAHCFLLVGEPDKALGELTLLHDLCRILQCAPTGKPITLVGAMIDVAVTGLYVDAVAEGLRAHAWREPQLGVLERQFGEIHLETALAETFVDEPMFTLRTLETSSRAELVKLFLGAPDSSKRSVLLLKYAPRGWLYQYMVVHARLNEKVSGGVDVANRTVLPRKIDGAAQVLQYNIDHVSPYNFLAYWWTPNWRKAVQRFAGNQTMANEGAVACALERYRLTHGEFPETLAELAPQFIDNLPHDLIGGQALKYRRVDGGQFLLYSIGWNETDDGGVPGKNIAEGDWVWGQSSQATRR
jgi:hypothetical protein